MKKVLALVLTLMMTVVVTACGGGNEDTKEQETGTVNETAEDTKTETTNETGKESVIAEGNAAEFDFQSGANETIIIQI